MQLGSAAVPLPLPLLLNPWLSVRARFAVGSTAAIAFVVTRASELLACPDCATARVVRAAIFEQGFWRTLLGVASPFAVVSLLAVYFQRGDEGLVVREEKRS